jgi:hypothetical protein
VASVGRVLARLVGWLLTPLVAWAASFVGASIGAVVTRGMDRGTTAFWITAGFGAVTAMVSAWAWLRLLRRSPKLQQTLAVAPDGTPLVAIESAPPEDAP